MRQAMMVDRETGRTSFWIGRGGRWLPVHRLAISRGELEAFGRALGMVRREALVGVQRSLAELRRRGQVCLVCCECGAAPVELGDRCRFCLGVSHALARGVGTF